MGQTNQAWAFFYKYWWILLVVIVIVVILIFVWQWRVAVINWSSPFIKVEDPANVLKTTLGHEETNTCWRAAAANMLAAAEYGSGTSLTDKATKIYLEMIEIDQLLNPDTPPAEILLITGWPQHALEAWLTSQASQITNNLYKKIEVRGTDLTTGHPHYPWDDRNAAMLIGNALRDCGFVGLNLRFPIGDDTGIVTGSWGHAVTAWGDDSGSSQLSSSPVLIKITDSDREPGEGVQDCQYDDFDTYHLGVDDVGVSTVEHEGQGWYLNYWEEKYEGWHPYIEAIVVLSQISMPTSEPLVAVAVASYKIFQSGPSEATGLHYEIEAEADILDLTTSVDWSNFEPYHAEDLTPQQQDYVVDWDFSQDPAPPDSEVMITTELVMSACWGFRYQNVNFNNMNLDFMVECPEISWAMESEPVEPEEMHTNPTGGYVVGSFDIYDTEEDLNRGKIAASLRFIQQYSSFQNPEIHDIYFSGSKGKFIANLRFGHSYTILSKDQLWGNLQWMPVDVERYYELGEESTKIEIRWIGELPYPDPGRPPTDAEIKLVLNK
jgi:hypothetical protein